MIRISSERAEMPLENSEQAAEKPISQQGVRPAGGTRENPAKDSAGGRRAQSGRQSETVGELEIGF
jgi:hypothetical protein